MADENNQSRAEWERERAAELESKTIADLAAKAARLEYDLDIKRKEITTLKEQLPPEGSVTLKGAEKDRWEAYNALGKPDDLKAAQTERDMLKADAEKRSQQDAIRDAAEVAGYKPRVLERLTPEGAAFEVREETKDGEKVKVAYIKVGDSTQPLTDWAASDPDFLPALVAKQEDGKPQERPRIPAQTTNGKEPEKGGIAQRQNQQAAPHLRPKTT